MTPLDHALALLRAGISVVPIALDGTKRPAVAWKAHQSRLATEDDARRWWGGAKPFGLAAVCGEVSGGLELIDFDRDTDRTYPEWCRLVEESCPGLLERLIVVRTPRRPVGGMHVWYRFPGIRQGNQKLASDPAAPGDERTLIETRGEGGYALVPGGPDAVHPAGVPYEYLAESLAEVPAISADDREFLLLAARSFDRSAPAADPIPKSVPGQDLRPGEDFERRASWDTVLGEHRWTLATERGGVQYWCRPGKGKGWSATVGHCKGADGAPLLRVFSSNADPFQPEKAYGLFRAYATLNFSGDLSRAASYLRSQGYGSPGSGGGPRKGGPRQEKAAPKPRADGDPPAWSVTLDGKTIAEGSPEDVLGKTEEEDAGAGRKTRVFDLRTLGCLLTTSYPQPRWLIRGIMSEGLNLLVGSPKQGKSLMALNLALTIAGGGKALGDVQVQAADVLYLSLEDQLRRVKERAVRMMKALPEDVFGPAKSRLTIVTDWPRQDEGGLRMIDLWRSRTPNPGLVIIDVWNRFSPAQKASGNIYMQDADSVSQVKRYCDRHGIAGMIVHHDRKVAGGGKEEDFVASISGTQGIAGSADGIMVLQRSRNETQAALKITGRDVEERELVLEFQAESLTWRSMGTVEQHATSRIQQAIMAHLKQRHPYGATAPEIAESIKEKPVTVRGTLNRLLGLRAVAKRGNNWHWPAEPPEEVFT